jgi:hypothetical protein
VGNIVVALGSIPRKVTMAEIKQFPFTPILGWSSTRYDMFSLCRRRYFYHYYGKYDQDFPIRKIQAMKNLVTVALEIGSIVHVVIETLLNRLKVTTEDIDLDKFYDYAKRGTEHRLRTQAFEEVFYGERPSIELEDVYPRITESLRSLLESPRMTWLQERPESTRSGWIVDPPGYGETRLGDLKIYCKVDFLCPADDGYQIIDWKTGKVLPDKHRKQLIGYSAWAAYHFETTPDKVTPTLAYLFPEYREVEETFNQFDLENFAVQVRAETDEMYEYCRDIERNIPLDKSEFPLIDDERICSKCNFRGLCFPQRYPVASSGSV